MIKEIEETGLLVLPSYIESSQEPVILDFYADWCGPCKIQSKNLDAFSDKHQNVPIYKINVEHNEHLAEKYQVQSIPALICILGENELWRHVGLITVEKLEEKYKK